jgi:protein-tyrosine phosphatase
LPKTLPESEVQFPITPTVVDAIVQHPANRPDARVLFICTGNYYRSRFSEAWFNHLALKHDSTWRAFSRGVDIELAPPGLSPFTRRYLSLKKVPIELTTADRNPLTVDDLTNAKHRIALKEPEHRPYFRRDFPEWEDRVEYLNFHDIDVAPAEEMLPVLEQHITTLFHRLHESTGSAPP